MIVFLIEEQGLHETIWTDIMEKIIHGTIKDFKWYIVALVAALTLYLIIFILALIKKTLITPIVNLTDHINNVEKDEDKRIRYQDRIIDKMKNERKEILQ